MKSTDSKYTISQMRLRILWWGRRCRLPEAKRGLPDRMRPIDNLHFPGPNLHLL
jgi:hypothetical protein